MIQKVKLNQGQILTKDNVSTYLTRARTGYDYCRFEMKLGTYITIAFFRDMSFDIMTNSRTIQLWQDIQIVRNTKSINQLTDYVFNWIHRYNR